VSEQGDRPEDGEPRPSSGEQGDAGAPAEGAQGAENPQAAEGPEGAAGRQAKGDADAAAEVDEAATDAGTPDEHGAGGGAAADAPADTQAEKPQDGGEVAEGKSADDVAGSDTGEAHGETLHDHPLVDSLGASVVHTDREGYLELCRALSGDGYNLFVGLTCVDYLVHPGRQLPPGVTPERFEVVVELANVATRQRIRVRCQVPDADPTLPTLFEVWPGSEAHERETYDMYGIVFEGHPDPSRILMPEDWEGHPLRKDYATGRIPVQFKESPGGR
jgi:NADH-quinone oxidoreductase subunit C